MKITIIIKCRNSRDWQTSKTRADLAALQTLPPAEQFERLLTDAGEYTPDAGFSKIVTLKIGDGTTRDSAAYGAIRARGPSRIGVLHSPRKGFALVAFDVE